MSCYIRVRLPDASSKDRIFRVPSSMTIAQVKELLTSELGITDEYTLIQEQTGLPLQNETSTLGELDPQRKTATAQNAFGLSVCKKDAVPTQPQNTKLPIPALVMSTASTSLDEIDDPSPRRVSEGQLDLDNSNNSFLAQRPSHTARKLTVTMGQSRIMSANRNTRFRAQQVESRSCSFSGTGRIALDATLEAAKGRFQNNLSVVNNSSVCAGNLCDEKLQSLPDRGTPHREGSREVSRRCSAVSVSDADTGADLSFADLPDDDDDQESTKSADSSLQHSSRTQSDASCSAHSPRLRSNTYSWAREKAPGLSEVGSPVKVNIGPRAFVSFYTPSCTVSSFTLQTLRRCIPSAAPEDGWNVADWAMLLDSGTVLDTTLPMPDVVVMALAQAGDPGRVPHVCLVSSDTPVLPTAVPTAGFPDRVSARQFLPPDLIQHLEQKKMETSVMVLFGWGKILLFRNIALSTTIESLRARLAEEMKVLHARKGSPLVDLDVYCFRVDGSDENLEESTRLQDLTYVLQCRAGCITPKLRLFHRNSYLNSMPCSSATRDMIQSLISKPLTAAADFSEISTFRASMQRVRYEQRMKSKLVDEYHARRGNRLSLRVCHSPLSDAHRKFLITIILPENEMRKTVEVQPDERACQLISRVAKKYAQNNGDGDPAERFVLKAAGLADYLFGEVPVSSFEYVRSRIAKKQKIELILHEVKKSEDGDSSDEDEVEEPLPEEQQFCYKHYEITADSLNWDEICYLSIAGVNRLFRLQIIGAEGLESPLYDLLHRSLSKYESIDVAHAWLSVSAGIYHGGSLIDSLRTTSRIRCTSNPRWYEWLVFGINISDLPRAARVCITLNLHRHKEEISVAWVNSALYNFKHELRQGTLAVGLWPDAKANPIGTCVPNHDQHAALMYVKMEQFAHPVVYPDDLIRISALRCSSIAQTSSLEVLDHIIKGNPLQSLTQADKDALWASRQYLSAIPKSLPKLACGVNYQSCAAVMEMHRLLLMWPPLPHLDAMELLDARFSDPKVREYAVSCLSSISDEELSDYLLQLVQVLKYELYHDSPLARFLIARALNSRRVGHLFFWYLRSEMHVPEISERFGLLLQAYLLGCGAHRKELYKQDQLMQQLVRIARMIKVEKDATRRDIMLKELAKIQFTSKIQLPLNPALEVKGLILSSCKYMDSKKLPLWLVFENADPQGKPIYVIFKEGDDLRQDMLTLQMLRIMEKLWKADGLDLQMSPYGCISTGDEVGMIEVVLNSTTTASISKQAAGAMAAFKEEPLANWIKEKNPTEQAYKAAVDAFVHSCAGYCVATYVLGIGDRHNDNIMVTHGGRLFHIDFGHFLGNYKKKKVLIVEIKREAAPFVLTPDYAYVMGGASGEQFAKFVELCGRAYNILRRHSHRFINLFLMMLSTGIPELQKLEDILYLQNALRLDADDETAAKAFKDLIYESLSTWTTQFNNFTHIMAH